MAVKFKSVSFKNFFSYGNKETTYNFEDKSITRLIGGNGCGKSVLIEAVYFSLFGKPYRKVKNNSVINDVNKKNCELRIEFSVGGSEYKVIRGLKPNIFEIYRDKLLINQDARSKDYQKVLEDILGFNESIFNQISIKSLTKNASFMDLAKKEKRNLIENLFELETVSILKDINREEFNKVNNKIDTCEHKILHYNALRKQELDNIEKLQILKRELEQQAQEEIEGIKTEIKTIQKYLDKLKKAKEKIGKTEETVGVQNNDMSDMKKVRASISKKCDKIDTKIDYVTEKFDFILKKCSGCSKIPKISDDSEISNLKIEKDKLIGTIEELDIRIDEIVYDIKEFDSILSKKSKINDQYISKKGEHKTLVQQQQKVKQKVDINVDQSKLKEYTDVIAKLEDIKVKLDKESSYNDAINSLLNDDGVKSYIIKKYLPLINKYLNVYLQKFGLEIELAFNTDLDIEIVNKIKAHLSYHNFSEGQKKRIDASILFAFLEFCRIKHSKAKTNMLILDEFASSLDSDGENVMYSILKEFASSNNLDVIVISHGGMVDPSNIDRTLEVKRERGFSHIELVEQN